jgi:metal-dependent amidase/aminoacylase/carboxypeptidase family protein
MAQIALGSEFVSDRAKPTMGVEDFAYYGAECPSCFYQLGLNPEGRNDFECVHTPYFYFNDESIEVGDDCACPLERVITKCSDACLPAATSDRPA